MKTFTATLAVLSVFVISTTAQTQYHINPTSVTNGTKIYWCQQQISQCPLICLQTPAQSSETKENSCDSDTLQYECVCGDGQSPNVNQYSQTLPFFICQEWGNQCVDNCGPADTACQSACRQNHPCGAQNPTRVNTSTIVRAPTTSGSGPGGAIITGFGGSAASSSPGSGAAGSVHHAALNVGRAFGMMGVVGLLTGGFAVLL